MFWRVPPPSGGAPKPPSEDDKPVETIRDHETGARAKIMVDAMPKRQRGALYFLRWMYEQGRIER